MNIYLAPLEGITGNIFRTSQHKYFGGIDKYFTPFISPTEKGKLSTKVLRDISTENNEGQILVPQILTNSAEGFLTMCKSLNRYGYTEFNLNLGCPSGTVVSKGRGSGFLAYPEKLDRFLEDIFESNYKISVKTRIGKDEPEEFYRLMEIFNKYPMTELIIHPRTRKDMYNNIPNLDMYEYAVKNSKNKLCYNGDILSLEDYNAFFKRFPDTSNIMVGRGVITNPALPLIIKGKGSITIENLKDFYNSVYSGYSEILYGNTPLLYKMKELMSYVVQLFEDNEKIAKKLKKSKNINEFNCVVAELFAEYRFR